MVNNDLVKYLARVVTDNIAKQKICTLSLNSLTIMCNSTIKAKEIYKEVLDILSSKRIRFIDSKSKIIFPYEHISTILSTLRNNSSIVEGSILSLAPTSISHNIEVSMNLLKSNRVENSTLATISISGIPTYIDRNSIARKIDAYVTKAIPNVLKDNIAFSTATDIVKGLQLPVVSTGTKYGKTTFSSAAASTVTDIRRVDRSQDWSSIVNIINNRLPAALIELMKWPRLVNRTGRFAHSAKVTAFNKINGNNYFTFDYRQDPYVVFDTRYGRSPWSKGLRRDPKKLISDAIRKILKDLAYTKLKDDKGYARFYTRWEGRNDANV